MKKLAIQMYDLMERLFPICRSITGNGVRQTLRIIKEHIPLDIKEIKSGTKVFDWEIPKEWNIKDAYVKDSTGKRIIDFNESNLHVVSYSTPFEGTLNLNELKKNLYTLPNQPDLIPYVTSYYKKRWGFCITQNQYEELEDIEYDVKIDSSLESGSLTYADLVIPGESEQEILFSTYVCHPSMANNELSGPVVATFLAKYLLGKKNNYYTYRFVFVPETIGAIAYISHHLNDLKRNVIAGYVITCIGDKGPFSYLKSRNGEELVDRVTIHLLNHSGETFKIYDFLSRGSDERQYCSPGVNLPVGSLMRTKYHEYPEYHTSGDNLSIIEPNQLVKSLQMYKQCLQSLENNRTYKTIVNCEPQLGKRNLYPTISKKGSTKNVKNMMNLLAYCDGHNDLLSIAEKINVSILTLLPIIEDLIEKKVLKEMKK
jgi:aminopeptidase-like protein